MFKLLPAQLADLERLKWHCTCLGTEFVVIGAVALQINFSSQDRYTTDIDLAVALDLDNFKQLEKLLQDDGWVVLPQREHRWTSKQGSLVDLLPAGPKLREKKQLVWPGSGTSMSLVGFDFVFSKCHPTILNKTLTVNVIDPIVLLLLKIVAFMEDQDRRAKDLPDIRAILTRYEAENQDRLFSDLVFDANLNDFKWVNAFLAGRDLKALLGEQELNIIRQFLKALIPGSNGWRRFRNSASLPDDRTDEAVNSQLLTFSQGLLNEMPINR